MLANIDLNTLNGFEYESNSGAFLVLLRFLCKHRRLMWSLDLTKRKHTSCLAAWKRSLGFDSDLFEAFEQDISGAFEQKVHVYVSLYSSFDKSKGLSMCHAKDSSLDSRCLHLWDHVSFLFVSDGRCLSSTVMVSKPMCRFMAEQRSLAADALFGPGFSVCSNKVGLKVAKS